LVQRPHSRQNEKSDKRSIYWWACPDSNQEPDRYERRDNG
jgi:hypothetical protein